MHSFEELVAIFSERFTLPLFPQEPRTLYGPCDYFLTIGGKRIRPILCLMGHELFEEIGNDTFNLAIAVELFHNFTLIHDDIMDKAALRRGKQTVHTKYGDSVALLGGDVMMVKAYEYINKIDIAKLHPILTLFNTTARQICEGQQLDMDYEKIESVSFDAYLKMIQLKTSVLLAASLEMGAMLGGASERNRTNIYQFGLKLGMAFQVQDDYLDAFGDKEKFGKETGGDIRQNKKTFLLIRALETANETTKKELLSLLSQDSTDKVDKVKAIFNECGVSEWADQLKESYLQDALYNLEHITVTATRKAYLRDLANFLIFRQH